jgi:hypothetical protein
MRKFLVALSVLLFVGVAANAQTQDVKKASTETKKECCAKSKDCAGMTASTTGEKKTCCKEMSAATADKKPCCKEMSVDSKTVKTETTGTTAEAKKCDPAKCEMAKK